MSWIDYNSNSSKGSGSSKFNTNSNRRSTRSNPNKSTAKTGTNVAKTTAQNGSAVTNGPIKTTINSEQKLNDAVSTPKVDISKLVDDKRKLLDLKTNIENIVRYLNGAIENLETPSSRINDLYNIDSVSIDNGRINAIRQDLINRRNYLNNVVLIELDQNIKKINESIG